MERVEDAAGRFLRYAGHKPGLVAVSGGADSVALLCALRAAGADIRVGHFHHQLRGEAADGDERFVRQTCEGLRLAYHVGTADVRAAGGNLEATARRLRYEWLARTAAEVGAGWVATAHTADDQAETVLHRMIRGTGVKGLAGVAWSWHLDWPGVPGTWVERPFLHVPRADILAYLNDLGRPFRVDATNADPAFTRSRIRHELLPLLKTFNPEVVAALGRLAEQADGAADLIREQAWALLDRVERPRAGPVVVLDATGFRDADGVSLSMHLIREMFHVVWEREEWPAGRMTFAHWERLLRIALGYETAADFPDGVHVRGVGRVVQLGRHP